MRLIERNEQVEIQAEREAEGGTEIDRETVRGYRKREGETKEQVEWKKDSQRRRHKGRYTQKQRWIKRQISRYKWRQVGSDKGSEQMKRESEKVQRVKGTYL